MTKHWIFERALAISVLVVFRIIDAQAVFHFQMAAIGRSPFSQQKREIWIEDKLIGPARVLDRDFDFALGNCEFHSRGREFQRIGVRADQALSELDFELTGW